MKLLKYGVMTFFMLITVTLHSQYKEPFLINDADVERVSVHLGISADSIKVNALKNGMYFILLLDEEIIRIADKLDIHNVELSEKEKLDLVAGKYGPDYTMADFYSNYGSSRTHSITVSPGAYNFEVNAIAAYKYTEWYVNGSWKETDDSGFWRTDPDYTYNFTSSAKIEALVYNSSWNYEEKHVWNVTVAKPDLIVSDIKISPSSPTAGESATITATLKNQGAVSCGTFYLKYYIDGSEIGTDAVSGGLNAGSPDTETISTTVNSSGNHTVKVIVDYDNRISEGNETNNTRQETYYWNPPPKPDLIVESIEITPSNPTTEDNIVVKVWIENIGNASSGSFSLKYYLDGSNKDSDNNSGISAGRKDYETTTLGKLNSGSHTVKIEVNPVANESNPGNNSKTKTFNVKQYLNETGVTVNTAQGKWNKDVTLKAKLQYKSGLFWYNLVNQKVSFYVNGNFAGADNSTNSSGEATITYRIPTNFNSAQKYSIKAKFEQSGIYAATENTDSDGLTIQRHETSMETPDITAFEDDNVALKATLRDKDNNNAGISGKKVLFYKRPWTGIGKGTYIGEAFTNSSGVATLVKSVSELNNLKVNGDAHNDVAENVELSTNPITPQDYSMTIGAYFDQDNQYEGSNDDGKLSVGERKETRIDLSSAKGKWGKSVSITAKLEYFKSFLNWDPVPSKNVELWVNGSKADTKPTNSSGVATFNYPIPTNFIAQDYEIKAIFNKDNAYKAFEEKDKLTVERHETEILVDKIASVENETVILTASLNDKDLAQNKVPDKKLSFFIEHLIQNNPIGEAYTDQNGVAKLVWKVDPDAKSALGLASIYDLERKDLLVKFSGDEFFNSSQSVNQLEISTLTIVKDYDPNLDKNGNINGLGISEKMEVKFSEELNENNITQQYIILRRADGSAVDYRINYVKGNLVFNPKIEIIPNVDLTYGTLYTLELKEGISDIHGNLIDLDNDGNPGGDLRIGILTKDDPNIADYLKQFVLGIIDNYRNNFIVTDKKMDIWEFVRSNQELINEQKDKDLETFKQNGYTFLEYDMSNSRVIYYSGIEYNIVEAKFIGNSRDATFDVILDPSNELVTSLETIYKVYFTYYGTQVKPDPSYYKEVQVALYKLKILQIIQNSLVKVRDAALGALFALPGSQKEKFVEELIEEYTDIPQILIEAFMLSQNDYLRSEYKEAENFMSSKQSLGISQYADASYFMYSEYILHNEMYSFVDMVAQHWKEEGDLRNQMNVVFDAAKNSLKDQLLSLPGGNLAELVEIYKSIASSTELFNSLLEKYSVLKNYAGKINILRTRLGKSQSLLLHQEVGTILAVNDLVNSSSIVVEPIYNISAGDGQLLIPIKFSITNADEWTADIEEGSDWLSFAGNSSGNGEGSIKLNYLSNPSNNLRKAKIKITSSNAINSPLIIEIMQSGSQPYLEVSQQELFLESTQETASLILQNIGSGSLNWNLEITSSNNWLSAQNQTSGSLTSDPIEIMLSSTLNRGIEPREAIIKFTSAEAENGEVSVTVIQAAGQIIAQLIPDPQQLQPFTHEANCISINLTNSGTANMSWSASVTEGSEWLYIESGNEGVDGGEIRFCYTLNELFESRIGYAVVYINETSESIELRFVQLGNDSYSAPYISWVQENLYFTDGINYAKEDSLAEFIFKIVYTDSDNHQPAPSFPKLHIRGSQTYYDTTLTMFAESSNDPINGIVYVSSILNLPSNQRYSYSFDVLDETYSRAENQDDFEGEFYVYFPFELLVPPTFDQPEYDGNEGIILTWNKIEHSEIAGYKIYKQQISSSLHLTLQDSAFISASSQAYYNDKYFSIGDTIHYSISAIDSSGAMTEKDSTQTIVPQVTSVINNWTIEKVFISQNYPNPFNPTTQISFGLPESQSVSLEIFNMLGEKIAVLLFNEQLSPGYHSVDFNASNLPSGIYIYQLRAGNFIDSKKMILLK
ncbi:MAG: T9SS type A sorting domain-containing protein [Candidatus Cloacimonetes bacterium]|nr:T9SS type A sorting domain-containing protein [Candidatus Cloacimonadota bacterium]